MCVARSSGEGRDFPKSDGNTVTGYEPVCAGCPCSPRPGVNATHFLPYTLYKWIGLLPSREISTVAEAGLLRAALAVQDFFGHDAHSNSPGNSEACCGLATVLIQHAGYGAHMLCQKLLSAIGLELGELALSLGTFPAGSSSAYHPCAKASSGWFVVEENPRQVFPAGACSRSWGAGKLARSDQALA